MILSLAKIKPIGLGIRLAETNGMRSFAFTAIWMAFLTLAVVSATPVSAQTVLELKVLQHQTATNDLCTRIWSAVSEMDPGIHIVTIPPRSTNSRSDAALKDGLADADCGRVKTGARSQFEVFSQKPILTIHIVAVSRADEPITIKSWADLVQISALDKILINQGSPFISKLQTNGLVNIDDSAAFSENNLLKLVNNRGRVFIHRSPGIESKIRNLNLTKLVRISEPLDQDELYVVYSRHLSSVSRDRVEGAISQLRKSGELARITSMVK
jgi:ABC-type amino acid transport substrate-binding protein